MTLPQNNPDSPQPRIQTQGAINDILLRSIAFILALLLGLPLWTPTPWALLPAAAFALAVYFASPATNLLMLLTLSVSYMVAAPRDSLILLLYVLGLHVLFAAMALLSRTARGSLIPLEVLKMMAKQNLPLQALSQALAAVALLAGDAEGPVIVVAAGGLALCILALWLARAHARR